MNERWNEVDDLELRQVEVEMADALLDVRTAATLYAERAWTRGEHTAIRPVRRSGWMAWGAASLAAMVLTVGGVHVLHHRAQGTARETPITNVQVQETSTVSDEALLEQIQGDLSSGVPAAMEPLATTDAKSAREAVKQRE